MSDTDTADRGRRCPDHPRTLGEHLKRRRFELKITLKEAAGLCRVTSWTLRTWETDRAAPKPRQYPGVLAYLGHDPFPPLSTGNWLVACRRGLGLSRKAAAKLLGISKTKLAQWENGTLLPTGGELVRAEKLLTGDPEAGQARSVTGARQEAPGARRERRVRERR